MGYFLSKLLGALLTPGALLVIGIVAGSALLWTRGHWRLGRGILTALAIIFPALVLLPVQPKLTGMLEDRFPANPHLPAHVDGIIVLGGVVDQYISDARHQISLNDAAERLIEAARLAKEHPEARVLFTGGSADPIRPEPREATLAAELLEQLGVPHDRLVVEDESRNTYENAVFSQRLLNPLPGQSWVLITSARHMPRAVGVFRHVGWPVIPWPVDFNSGGGSQWTNLDVPVIRLKMLTQAMHEWVGLVFYRLSGWTDKLFPAP